jgi:ATP-binding cassette subfamily F protein uup
MELLGKDIESLNREKSEVTESMHHGDLSFEALDKLSRRIMEISSLLDGKELRWLELSEMA